MIENSIKSLKLYSLLHSPNPYRVYQLANSSITVNVQSNGQIQFIVSIGAGDPVSWRVYINAKHDHGQGNFGGDYPYAVETVTSSQNSTFYRTANTGQYWPDDYSAVLALVGVGEVDFATFTIGGTPSPTPPPCQPPGGVQRYCGTDNKTLYVWNTVTCKYDSQICSTNYCQNGQCVNPPTGDYIISWHIYNGVGGKINVYKNGVLFGTVSGSSIKVLVFRVGDVLKYEAIPDSGWTYEKTCNDGDNTCDSSNPYEGTIAVPMSFSAVSTFSQPIQYHNVCQNNICTRVIGGGTNECSNIGLSCSGVPYHNICQNNVCTRVSGTGTDECNNVGLSCGGTTVPPPPGGCTNCDLTNNYCVMNSCIPKSYVLYGGIGILAFMMFRR